MELRAYAANDAPATHTAFVRAVRETARAHHTPAQIEAWAAEGGDLDGWAEARASADTIVAVIDGQVVGFTDLDDHGYVDMLFVHPDFGRRGIGSALLASVVARARSCGLPALTTFASVTSRSVFERCGFAVTGERFFGEGDGATKTYAMQCVLSGPTDERSN